MRCRLNRGTVSWLPKPWVSWPNHESWKVYVFYSPNLTLISYTILEKSTMLRIEGSEYFGRMVDGDILKLYVKGTVEETHQKYATDAVVELLRPTLEVEVRVQKYPLRGLHKAGTRAKKRNFNLRTKLRPLRGNPRQSWILDSSTWIPHSFSVEIGFRITIISGIPDSKVLDSGFYRQKLKKNIGIRILIAKVSRNPFSLTSGNTLP